MQKIELLAPAGDLLKLKTAIDYGADAVYIGGEAFGLRTASKNFDEKTMAEAVNYAHERNKKVYLTTNIIPHNSDLSAFPKYIENAINTGIDALIIADLGLFSYMKKNYPNFPLHISTQANNTNFWSANAWHDMGASRVVLARELSLNEIKTIRQNTPKDLEIEAFVHGAMCVSYSGRCLLSNYLTHRDANKGACAQPCRWNYALVEQTRPGEYMPIGEGENGSFILNSKDLCMLGHIKELAESGITSFKIEGRVKSEYYVASTVKAYRDEIDKYESDPENYKFDIKSYEEVLKTSHRPYSTGFYLGKTDETSQVYTSSSYIRDYDLVGYVVDYDSDSQIATVEQRNKFSVGDTVEFLVPGKPCFAQKVTNLTNEKGEEIESTPHAQMIFKIKTEKPVFKGCFVRKGSLENNTEFSTLRKE